MRFGTDGLRGRAGTEITAEVAWRVGHAVASTLGARVVVARDTRPSGPELEDAVLAGIRAAGGTAVRAGVLPTPGLSVLVAEELADAGVMITASHNPAHDNGLKVLARGGTKLEAEGRAALEAALMALGSLPDREARSRDGGVLSGRPGVVTCEDPRGRYGRAVMAALPAHVRGRAWLAGHTVVIDAANGAGAGIAAEVLDATGARVVSIADGGGPAINQGVGAVHPEAMAAAVRAHGASAGLALDGDGDRVVLADARGRIVDGDAILYLLAHGPVAVGTVMSNAGCQRMLAARGTHLVRAAVGDANVADAMRVHAADIGAEPSGHVLFADGLPTGCGLLAGLRTLAETLGRGRDLDAALADYRPTFQAHAVAPRQPLDVLAGPIAALEADGARVVARPSGTEPVVRLMVEHADEARARGGLDTLLSILGAST